MNRGIKLDPSRAFADRDLINGILRDMLKGKPTAHWLSLLEPADIWCAEVLDWPALERSGALQQLGVAVPVADQLRAGAEGGDKTLGRGHTLFRACTQRYMKLAGGLQRRVFGVDQ